MIFKGIHAKRDELIQGYRRYREWASLRTCMKESRLSIAQVSLGGTILIRKFLSDSEIWPDMVYIKASGSL